MPGFRLVKFDDWEALYRTDTGEKIDEGHSIRQQDLLRQINADCDVVWAEDAIEAKAMETGYVPENLSEYPEGV